MDLPAGSLRGAGPSGSLVAGSEKGDRHQAGERVDTSKVGHGAEEEVGEHPQLPKEPCFARPAPWMYKIRQVTEQLGSLAESARIMLGAIATRGSAGLGGPPNTSVEEVEGTSPVDRQESPVTTRREVPEPSSLSSVQEGGENKDNLGVEVSVIEEGGDSEKPQLPKEPCASKPERPSGGVRGLLMKVATVATAAAVLLRELGERGLASVSGPRAAMPAVDAGVNSQQLESPLHPPSPLDVTQPGNPLPTPDDVASGGSL